MKDPKLGKQRKPRIRRRKKRVGRKEGRKWEGLCYPPLKINKKRFTNSKINPS